MYYFKSEDILASARDKFIKEIRTVPDTESAVKAAADFVKCLYNVREGHSAESPLSKGVLNFSGLLQCVQEVMLLSKDSPISAINVTEGELLIFGKLGLGDVYTAEIGPFMALMEQAEKSHFGRLSAALQMDNRESLDEVAMMDKNLER